MKKTKIFALALAVVMSISSMSALAAAGDVVFTEGFELDENSTFNLGVATLKTYGEELIPSGNFDSMSKYMGATAIQKATDFGATGDNGFYAVHKAGNGNANNGKLTFGDGNSVSGKSAWFPVHATIKSYLGYIFPKGVTFEPGVYEISAQVKGYNNAAVAPATGLPVSLEVREVGNIYDANGEFNKASTAFNIVPTESLNIGELGSQLDSVEIKSGWQTLKAQLVIDETLTTTTDLSLQINVIADTAELPAGYSNPMRVSVDNLSMKKVTNAELVTNTRTSGSSTFTFVQPQFKASLLNGKTATLTYPIENKTGADAEATVITALYDAEDRFVSVLDLTNETIAANTATVITKDIAIADNAGITDEHTVKCFIWDTLSEMTPIYNAKDYETPQYIKNPNTVIPDTNWTGTAGSNRYDAQLKASEQMNVLVTGDTARSGLNSFYMPFPKGESNKGNSMAYTAVPNLEAGKTYRLTFYMKTVGRGNDNIQDHAYVTVASSDIKNIKATSGNWLPLTYVYTDASGNEQKLTATASTTVETSNGSITMVLNAGTGVTKASRILVTPKANKGYIPHSFEFTTTTAGTHYIGFGKSFNGYVSKSNLWGCGTMFDDIVITEIG